MLEKSLSTPSDVIIYDLEDSVPPSPADKNSARARLAHFLSVCGRSLLLLHTVRRMVLRSRHVHVDSGRQVAVAREDCGPAELQCYFVLRGGYRPSCEHLLSCHCRCGNITEPLSTHTRGQLRLPCIRTLVLPKVHSVQDLHHVSEEIYIAYKAHKLRDADGPPVQLVASIESAKAMHNLGEIASWQSRWGAATGGTLAALLVRLSMYSSGTQSASTDALSVSPSLLQKTVSLFKAVIGARLTKSRLCGYRNHPHEFA